MAARVRLKKKYFHRPINKTWPIGQILQVDNNLALELLADKTAEIYTGEYPPKSKMKTDFFKTKTD